MEKRTLTRVSDIAVRISVLMIFTCLFSVKLTSYSQFWPHPQLPLYIAAFILFALAYPMYYHLTLTDEDETISIPTYLIMLLTGSFVFGITSGTTHTLILHMPIWLTGMAFLFGAISGAGFIVMFRLYPHLNNNQPLWEAWANLDDSLMGISWYACTTCVALCTILLIPFNPMYTGLFTAVLWFIIRIVLYGADQAYLPGNPRSSTIVGIGTFILGAAIGYVIIPHWSASLIGGIFMVLVYMMEGLAPLSSNDIVITMHNKYHLRRKTLNRT